MISKARIPRRRHRLPHEDVGEDVAVDVRVGVGVVECELNGITYICNCVDVSKNMLAYKPRPLFCKFG